MSLVADDEGAHLVGRLILALADGALEKVAEVIDEDEALNGDDSNVLLLAVAGFAAILAEQALGEDWRIQLGTALNGLEMRTSSTRA